MMSPNKNKRGVASVREASPEAGPSALSPKHCGSDLKDDDVEENVPKRGGTSQYGPNSLRSFGFSGKKKPAELFRKDLISAMKLADKDSLPEESYFLISDPWRQEWEKGVQVPVNVTDIKQAKVKEVHEKRKTGDFKMPHKLLHERTDEVYKKGQHELSGMPELADQLVRYDLDDLDVSWLEEINFRLREMGLNQITEWNMERIMEAFENECHKNMTEVMKTEEGMGIEYDEDVVCDVCRSPESEETNEMVFCDKCDICIHQACYGINTIPQGSWMCRTCALGIKPTCILCPNIGGAMKCTRSGTQWAHVSCALWIPEVGFGDPDKVEPVTKISQIPPSRWSLTCRLCKERMGACIQCSVKSCKTAFHVTCAFNDGLLMKTVLDERAEAGDVKLKAFCPKHSKRRERSQSESELDTPRKKGSFKDSPCKRSPRKDGPPTPKKELTQEERANLRSKKLKSLEEEFYKVVDLSSVCKMLQLDEKMVNIIFFYWKLKRKCNWDKPLLTPKTEEEDILEKQEEDSRVARRKMFVHLRHDLERARNLCYMISKREKMKRQLFHNKEHVFKNMARVLKNKSLHLSKANVSDIVQNYHFDSVYDDYGRSVEKLPGELSEEENESSEMEDNNSACSVSTENTENMVGESGKKTGLQSASSKDTEGCEGKLKPRRSKGMCHKTRRRGRKPKEKKELENQALTSASEASAIPVKNNEEETDDDNVLIMSADESEDETVRRLPGTMAVKSSRWKGGKNSLWSTAGGFRRVRHKKPRRGRKPWYEKRKQCFELTPNLTLSTDDDDDTKDSFKTPQEECRENVDQDTVEENVVVDVIGEGETDEKSVVSVVVKSGSDRTCNRYQKPTSKRETNRRRKDKMERTKPGSGLTGIDTRTTVNDILLKCDSISVKNESSEDVNNVKEVESACRVLSFLPTRTSNRKRRKLAQALCDSDFSVTKVHDSSHPKTDNSLKVGASIKMESADEVERTSLLSPAKMRKSSRNHTTMNKMKSGKGGAPDTEVQVGKTENISELPDFHQQNKLLRLSDKQVVGADLPLDRKESAEVHRESRSQDTCHSSQWTGGDKTREMPESRERSESSSPQRRKRQSSYRARFVWNRLLASPGSSASSESKHHKSMLERSSQSHDTHSKTSSQCAELTDDRAISRLKIKQEKDAEKPDRGIKEDPDLQRESLRIDSLDSKKNDSKQMCHLVSGDVNKGVKNGFRGRHSRRGKRRFLANGILDGKQRKIDTFFARLSMESLHSEVIDDRSANKSPVKRVLNEISPEKRGSWQNNRAGKGSSTQDILGKHNTGDQLSANGAFESPRLHQGGEGSGKSVRRKDCPSGGNKELDTVSAFTKGQCETDQFSMDTLRAFRSQSPSSDASTITGLHLDSRESTPRRFTRSQLTGGATENSPCPRDADSVNHRRTKQRGHRLKSSKAGL